MSLLLADRPWTEVIALRRRGFRSMLCMTLLAFLGGWAWLGPVAASIWAVAVLSLMTVNRRVWTWIERSPRPGRRMEQALAGSTFIYTAVYSILPAVLITHGQGASPLVGGVCMLVAIALSATSEVVISRRVGGSALTALFLVSFCVVILRTVGEAWPDIVFAVLATIALHGCVLQFAMHRVRADQMMRAALAAAETANAAKSIFLATMSHEIRTPLNGVLGMAQAMSAEALSDVQRDRLAIIHDSGEALKTILNDVLDLSKVEAGKLEIEAIPFDLTRTLQAAVAPFEPLAAGKALALTLDVAPSALGVYRGDPARLRQVIGNLISNAVKFTDSGAISVAAWREGERLAIEVRDTGAGLPTDQIELLFGQFPSWTPPRPAATGERGWAWRSAANSAG